MTAYNYRVSYGISYFNNMEKTTFGRVDFWMLRAIFASPWDFEVSSFNCTPKNVLLSELLRRVTKVDKFRRVYKFSRVDTFPGVNKVIEFVNMMFIWILIIKMCYSWMCFLSC